jgi:hypothetical protein
MGMVRRSDKFSTHNTKHPHVCSQHKGEIAMSCPLITIKLLLEISN